MKFPFIYVLSSSFSACSHVGVKESMALVIIELLYVHKILCIMETIPFFPEKWFLYLISPDRIQPYIQIDGIYLECKKALSAFME